MKQESKTQKSSSFHPAIFVKDEQQQSTSSTAFSIHPKLTTMRRIDDPSKSPPGDLQPVRSTSHPSQMHKVLLLLLLVAYQVPKVNYELQLVCFIFRVGRTIAGRIQKGVNQILGIFLLLKLL